MDMGDVLASESSEKSVTLTNSGKCLRCRSHITHHAHSKPLQLECVSFFCCGYIVCHTPAAAAYEMYVTASASCESLLLAAAQAIFVLMPEPFSIWHAARDFYHLSLLHTCACGDTKLHRDQSLCWTFAVQILRCCHTHNAICIMSPAAAHDPNAHHQE